MADRSIRLRDHEVRAILDGSKTQTRRPITFARPEDEAWAQGIEGRYIFGSENYCLKLASHPSNGRLCPYGEPGDLLWVRECWATEDVEKPWQHVAYRADGIFGAHGGDGDGGRLFVRHGWLADRMPAEAIGESRTLRLFGGKWRPSIHMPRWASRLTLRLTDVRVERVQDITAADAQAEGVKRFEGLKPSFTGSTTPGWSAFSPTSHGELLGSPQTGFANAWNHAYAFGPSSWKANPWVWVLSFERAEAVRG